MFIKLIPTSLLFVSTMAYGQNDWLKFPNSNADSAKVTVKELNYNAPDGKVIVEKDARLDKLDEFVRAGDGTIQGVKIDGYRILIFFDQSKTAAEQKKAVFLSQNSGEKAYMDYSAPNYRVRVGNFRTKLEAEALKAELMGTFPTAIVVEDKIQLPTIPE
ncbi:SPOR domain-containing protein [Crocinitomix catalasitica]|uniref:SPOR domain-containing protein n=1 Tax=Crocinitomix catalasitica TaxID=184607 RepID=UPI00068510A0|nr:SPOR domain-containing protein [Crocinitomix catalasitica]